MDQDDPLAHAERSLEEAATCVLIQSRLVDVSREGGHEAAAAEAAKALKAHKVVFRPAMQQVRTERAARARGADEGW